MAVDKYTAGGLLQIRGNHMNFDKADLTQGDFLKPSSGAEVRVTEYATGLTGPPTLRVANYTNPLTTP